MILIPVFLVSMIPFAVLYLWLRNLKGKDEAYQKLCDRTALRGILCIFPVILFSAVSHIILKLTGLKEVNPFLHRMVYDFCILALSEEIVKFLTSRRAIRQTDYPCSWQDVTVLMSFVGIGFGFIEAIEYALGASVAVILVRGICVPHAGYGFLVGYFYGKGRKYGKKYLRWIGLLIAWLIHGMYDFSLSEEFLGINDNLAIVPLVLALAEIVLVILLIRFIRKTRNNPEYTEPLPAESSPLCSNVNVF